MHELGSLLGRWHQWRRTWSHERRYSRVALLAGGPGSDDDLEALTMGLVEQAFESLGPDQQLAIQHVARAECMGVEVITNPRLGDRGQRETLVAGALVAIERELSRAGVL